MVSGTHFTYPATAGHGTHHPKIPIFMSSLAITQNQRYAFALEDPCHHPGPGGYHATHLLPLGKKPARLSGIQRSPRFRQL